MDKISKSNRSWNMSRIKSTDTKPELLVRKYLFSQGYRYRVKTNLYGKPDIVFQNKKIVIFVNGCFWHQHKNCRLSYMPKSNMAFWREKLLKNIERDQKVKNKLWRDGWKTITVWECNVKNNLEKTLNKTVEQITL